MMKWILFLTSIQAILAQVNDQIAAASIQNIYNKATVMPLCEQIMTACTRDPTCRVHSVIISNYNLHHLYHKKLRYETMGWCSRQPLSSFASRYFFIMENFFVGSPATNTSDFYKNHI